MALTHFFILSLLLFSVCCFSHGQSTLTDFLDDPISGQQSLRVDLKALNTSSDKWLEILSYSGLIEVDKSSNSHLFFWFFPSLDGNQDAPILLWLQGGPGGSSMFGLFVENGPLQLDSNYNISLRETSWNQHYHMLYIDNPVGVGYSYTTDPNAFSTNEDEVSSNLYEALSQFFVVFANYSSNPFYVTGESYAGKYVPSLAYRIHQENEVHGKSGSCCNLAGIAVGDGAMDPRIQFSGFSALLYWFGIADPSEVQVIQDYELKMEYYLALEKYEEAFEVFDEFLNGDFYPYPTYFYNISGSNDYFNFLNPVYSTTYYPSYLNLEETKSLLHVGNSIGYSNYNSSVEIALKGDWMRSVAYTLPTLMENYKVLIYNGQNDLILGPGLVQELLWSLPWRYEEEFKSAPKQIWRATNKTNPQSPGSINGYIKQTRNFTQAIVLDAGHMVPLDQPHRTFDLITRFIEDLSFSL